jgi:hypothetical protein
MIAWVQANVRKTNAAPTRLIITRITLAISGKRSLCVTALTPTARKFGVSVKIAFFISELRLIAHAPRILSLTLLAHFVANLAAPSR